MTVEEVVKFKNDEKKVAGNSFFEMKDKLKVDRDSTETGGTLSV